VGLFSYYARWIPRFSDKIWDLFLANRYPLPAAAVQSCKDLSDTCLQCIRDDEPFVVECDALDFAITAVLSQGGQACSVYVTYSLKKWIPLPVGQKRSYLNNRSCEKVGAPFTWANFYACDRSKIFRIWFMFDQKRKGKIKNAKILSWRIELGTFSYNVIHRPGSENVAADALSRVIAVLNLHLDLMKIHGSLGHPGKTWLHHFIRSKNLPYSLEKVRSLCSKCNVCAELKPRIFKKGTETLKAKQPWDCISIDFKGPVRSRSRKPYLFVAVDEFSRFPYTESCFSLLQYDFQNCDSVLDTTVYYFLNYRVTFITIKGLLLCLKTQKIIWLLAVLPQVSRHHVTPLETHSVKGQTRLSGKPLNFYSKAEAWLKAIGRAYCPKPHTLWELCSAPQQTVCHTNDFLNSNAGLV